MPLLDEYLLCIAPVAARETANKTTMKNVPNFLAVSLAMAMRRYNTARITQ
jgi:hypothetical protein